MLQNATPLRKSAPWPPNISDEHVFCTAPATRNSSLQILFKCPTPAISFGNATKPSRFAHFDKVHNPLRLPRKNDIWTSKSDPKPSCFVHFDFEILMCFAPQRRALFRHLNFQKWSEAGVFCTFWLQNVLRATTACTFSTSQLPKAVRTWCVLYILTSKCASRHNGVQFFISHLARWLRTRRFSEPTFRPSGATNHWKNTVWGREKRRVEESRWADQRRERVRRKKIQRREKVGKSRNTKVLSSVLWKSKCTERLMFGWLLEGEMPKKCTPLWCEARLEAKMCKTQQLRTTVGSWDVEKVQAVVLRSTCRSQKCKKLRGTEHFWTFRCRFCVTGAGDCAPCQKWAKREGFLAVQKRRQAWDTWTGSAKMHHFAWQAQNKRHMS